LNEDTIQDNFLLIGDAGQEKVFQMNLFQREGEKANYSIIPLREWRFLAVLSFSEN